MCSRRAFPDSQLASPGRTGAVTARFWRSESAATAVEFALVAAPLLLLLFAIIEVSLMLAAQSQLQNAADAMSRLIRTGEVTAADGSIKMAEPDFRGELCAKVSLLRNCETGISLDIRNAARFADLAAMLQDPLAIGPQSSGESYASRYEPGGISRAGSLIVTYDWEFLGPLGVFGNLPQKSGARRISARAVYKNESF